MPQSEMHGGEANPVRDARGAVLRRRLAHTFHYWMETEVHVFGFSIAANVLLSFYPFLIVMISVCHKLLGWKTAGDAINLASRDDFPDQLGVFISSGLPHRSLQIASVFMLLFTANGIFEPLEVALNRAWGIRQNRSFVRNQAVSLGLIFVCGTLGLVSSLLTGMNMRDLGGDIFSRFMSVVIFKTAAVPMSILILFLIYWRLPNAKISPRFALPPAVFVGLALELLKYVNLLTWPLWRKKLHAEYGPFYYSVTILLLSFLAAMVILAGAEWAAQAAAEQRHRSDAQAAAE